MTASPSRYGMLDPIALPLSGTHLIEASAGTGKTHTITTLYLRLLLEQQRAVSEILVVTYTRAATRELRERIRRRLAACLRVWEAASQGRAASAPELERDPELLRVLTALSREQHGRAGERLERALSDFDEAAIFTIHAFCQKALAEWALQSKAAFDAELLDDARPLLREVVFDYWGRVAYPAPPEEVAALLSNGKGGAAPEHLLSLARLAVEHRDVAVLPERVALAEHDAQAYAQARARVLALWQAAREEVLAELRVPERLHRGRYPDGTVDRLAQALDAPEEAPATVLAAARRLCTSALSVGVRKGKPPLQHPFFDACEELRRLDELRIEADNARVLAVRRSLVDYARRELPLRKRERGLLGFDDLLHQLRDAIEGVEGESLAKILAARYPAALIDEFQDTDPVQYQIFRRLGGAGTRLLLIGDPKQAIYAFRGADIFAYLKAAREAEGRRHSLGVSYRSDPSLVHALNVVFGRVPRPFLFEEIGYAEIRPRAQAEDRLQGGPPHDAALTLLHLPAERAQVAGTITKTWGEQHLPAMIATEIADLLGSSLTVAGCRVEERDLAVLCRTNQQARDVQRALSEAGIPSVLDGDSSVFESETAHELQQVLQALVEPGHARRVVAALSSALFGLDAAELLSLQHDDQAFARWFERFLGWNQVLRERGFVQAMARVLQDVDGHQRLLSRPDGERRMTDLLHLIELLHEAATRQHLGPQALLHWLLQLRTDAGAGGVFAPEAAQLRLEHDEHAVRLTTIHRSKGLEYPIVYCPFLWAAPRDVEAGFLFHDRQQGHRLGLALGKPEGELKHWAREEELAENLRLVYVALTRARHRCFVVCGNFRAGDKSALSYLLYPGEAKPTDEAGQLAALRALSEGSGGAIALRPIAVERPLSRATPPPRAGGVLEARQLSRRLQAAFRVSSFSRLSAGQLELGGDAEEGRDHDQDDQAAQLAREAARAASLRIALADFPAGARSGTLVHAVYEHIDFASTQQGLRDEVDRRLAQGGLEVEPYGATLAAAIADTLATPLGAAPDAPRLSQVARADRLDELEFLFPVAHGQGALTAARLADLFERHAAPPDEGRYSAALRELGFAPLAGFLKGYIDLVFRHAGRYFLVDYKTNWLGEHVADYGPDALRGAMREHHYYLQYHLYTLALHRYLGLRVPGYDYARDFGGVYYLFVRGMAPAYPAGTGVFHDRPAPALIAELDALMRDPEAA